MVLISDDACLTFDDVAGDRAERGDRMELTLLEAVKIFC